MAELKDWGELAPGGAVVPSEAPRLRTGGWRTGVKPCVDIGSCVNCLLCWLHCPDSAIRLDGTVFAGFDYDYCKGCEICAAVCPVDAIAMVVEETVVPPDGVLR
jgi:2-oxoacid:acceptor oxidoreductase delta subunit (pyruvate/2-ketoisovalerate family)